MPDDELTVTSALDAAGTAASEDVDTQTASEDADTHDDDDASWTTFTAVLSLSATTVAGIFTGTSSPLGASTITSM